MISAAYDVEVHRTGIGASSSAACLGLSPYRTAFQEYERFCRAIDGKRSDDPIDPERSYFGHAMEPVIARAFEREQRVKVRRNKRTFRSKDYPHLIATPDGFILGQRKLFEMKTAGLRTIRSWGEEGTDEVPMHYLVQCAHQMLVMGYDEAQLAVLLGANDLRVYTIKRDGELEQLMLARLTEFWRRLQDRDPPEPTTLVDVGARWRTSDGSQITATPEIVEAVRSLKVRRTDEKAHELESDGLELTIKKFIGEHSTLVDASGRKLVTWNAHEQTRFNESAFKAAHPDLYEQFRTPRSMRPFLLK